MHKEIELLGEEIAADIAHLDAALHAVLEKIRTFDEGGGWYRQGFRSCADWLSWRVGWNLGTAREHVRVARRLVELPQIDEALRVGKLSYSKVRAITRVATPAIEAVLLEDALLTTGQQLEMICRKYATVQRHGKELGPRDERDRRNVRRRDLDDGMVRIEATLHPEEAAVVWAALERIAAEKCREPQRAEVIEAAKASECQPVHQSGATSRRLDVPAGTSSTQETRKSSAFDRAGALVAMAQAVIRGEHGNRSPYQLMITVAAPTLQRDAADPSSVACCADGTCISTHAARRLGCDASTIELVEDATGAAISVGRKTRTIPGPMKRALLQRDRTCRFPGCRTRVFLEGHHIEHWADGGETKLSNLIACCDYHHRFVHEHGYRIELRPEGDVVVFDDVGRPMSEVPEVARVVGRGRAMIARHTADLEIDPDTRETWNGHPIDYVLVIDEILRTRVHNVASIRVWFAQARNGAGAACDRWVESVLVG
ncbi:MAG: HNH endonuclease [Myxococcota bacterium]|nr:HNH endonuclease [Myxococcota bacterium]